MLVKLPAKWYAIVSLILIGASAAAAALLQADGVQGKAKMAIMVVSVVVATLTQKIAPQDEVK